MKDAEFAAMLESLKAPAWNILAKNASASMGYWMGYLDGLNDVRRAYAQAEGEKAYDQAGA